MAKKNKSIDDAHGAKDRLQPALLDRLVDHSPEEQSESMESVFVTDRRLRESLVRDLAWLLNTSAASAQEFDGAEEARNSVLNFGIPPLAGKRSSDAEQQQIETALREAIERFEPRILPDTIDIKRVETLDANAHRNTLHFHIRCHYWSEPYPLELLLGSSLDLESGQIQLNAIGEARPNMKEA